jgi:hypothetical protein
MLELAEDRYRSGWSAAVMQIRRNNRKGPLAPVARAKPKQAFPSMVRRRPFPGPTKGARPQRLPSLNELKRFRPDAQAHIRSARKLIFLDVDGVLNTDACRPRDALKARLVERLAQCVLRTGSRIVLSSTWRLHAKYRAKLLKRLETAGVDRCLILDDTPQLPFDMKCGWPACEHNRACEIHNWMERAVTHPDLKWVAIDDLDVTHSPHAQFFRGHFVHTTKKAGLTEACADAVVRILGPRSPRK